MPAGYRHAAVARHDWGASPGECRSLALTVLYLRSTSASCFSFKLFIPGGAEREGKSWRM